MPVTLPIQNFFSRTIQPTTWVRPNDWPIIIDTPNEVQFLFSDINESSCTIRTQFSRTSGSQNLVIDWGDGTTNTITSTSQTDTSHVYEPGTGTPCSLGYTTFKIRIYFTGVGSSVLSDTRIFPILPSGSTTGNRYQECALLEIYYGDNTQTTNPTSYYGGGQTQSFFGSFNFLEYVKLPSSVPWTNMANMFNLCSSLSVVVMPTSASSVLLLNNTFSFCYKLQSIVFPSNMTGVTNMASCFNTCTNLTSVVFPTSLNSCTTLSSAFNACSSLKQITLPSINSVTTFSNTFTSCYSLEWVKFSSLPTFGSLTSVDFTNCFSNCYNLQNVYFPSSCSSNSNFTFSATFSTCAQLKTITFPLNFNPNTLSSCFLNNYSLKKVVFQSPSSRCINMAAMFSGCYSLTNVILPQSVSAAGVSLASTFSSCFSLESITISSTYIFTSLLNTFQNCYSLKSLNWSPSNQNSLTTMGSTFQSCSLLTSVILPTSLNVCTSLDSTFSNCFSLSGVTFPTQMNLTTTMNNTFNSCVKLKSVSLPSSMTSCTLFSTTFQNCFNLKSVVFPTTVGNVTSFVSCFNQSNSLESVTFPTNQLSGVTNITTLFNGCMNLKTINNFNKIGSLTSTPLCNASSLLYNKLTSISFYGPLSILQLNGLSNTDTRANVQSVRLLNTSTGQWTGVSPQINVSNTNMSTSDLIQLFNDMAAQGNVVSKTINITNASGAAGLSVTNRQIITNKGWTITG